MDSTALAPADAARELGLAPSTLRLYSTRFADFLSPEAARPPPLGPNRPGYRRYRGADLTVLGRAKELLSHGLTYRQVIAELGSAGGAHDRGGSDAAAALQEIADAWRSLGAEWGREARRLRDTLAAVRADIGQLRDELEATADETRRLRRAVGRLLGDAPRDEP